MVANAATTQKTFFMSFLLSLLRIEKRVGHRDVPGTTTELFLTDIQIRRALLSLSFILVMVPLAFAADLIGQASIIDGDTLEIHGTRIRLWGIDAPESSQLCRGEDSLQYRCGAKAANALDAFMPDGR
jgi:endonuclease YncB( thermonuclease family)